MLKRKPAAGKEAQSWKPRPRAGVSRGGGGSPCRARETSLRGVLLRQGDHRAQSWFTPAVLESGLCFLLCGAPSSLSRVFSFGSQPMGSLFSGEPAGQGQTGDSARLLSAAGFFLPLHLLPSTLHACLRHIFSLLCLPLGHFPRRKLIPTPTGHLGYPKSQL